MGHLGSDGRPFAREELERLERALFLLTRTISEQPPARLDVHLLKDWHRQLSADHPRMTPGMFRSGDITFGTFYGAPPAFIESQTRQLLSDVEDQIGDLDLRTHSEPQTRLFDAVVALGCTLHVSLIRIHPFVDGNGRLSRLAHLWVHRRFGYKPPAFTDRASYLAALNRALYRGELDLIKLLTLKAVQDC